MRLMTATRDGLRPEIQALRAIAVLLVVVYHFWPDYVPGGYVGVDIFFVISGFLITSHLLNQAARTGSIKLAEFWARRARRLLPASLLVVLVSAAATLLFVPVTFWKDFFFQMGGSVFYVLNWLLARDAVDYLASENNASPVQHYWSLSIEEQFYIVWPLLILVAVLIGRRLGAQKRAIVISLTAVVVVSFVTSVYVTETNPAAAYFITPTRAWEFGLGGLLVFAPTRRHGTLRSSIAWLGIGGIVATGLLYSGATAFPGYAALLPTISTAAVIWAGTTRQAWSAAQLSRFRPIQYTGDLSYSLYLWHWPLIVIAPFVLHRPLGPVVASVLFLASFLLASATKKYVEDPWRRTPVLTARRPRVTLTATAIAMIVTVIFPVAGFMTARTIHAQEIEVTNTLLESDSECLGAAALAELCNNPQLGESLFPGLASFKNDNRGAYACYQTNTVSGGVHTCSYGPTSGTRVAITGDSHAAMLIPGLKSRGNDLGWRIDTFVGRGCSWAAPNYDEECAAYRQSLHTQLLDGQYALVIFTAYRGPENAAVPDRLAEARAAVWTELIDAGTNVVVLADNPPVPDNLVDCVPQHGSLARAENSCRIPADFSENRPDPLKLANAIEPRAHLIDVTDLYCTDIDCPMVIGNTIVYRDAHHVTGTYMRTLMPHLLERISKAIASGV